MTWNIYLIDVSICLHLLFFLLSSFTFIPVFTSVSIPGIYLETYSSKFSWREILYRFRIDIVNIDLRWAFISWSAQHHSHLFSKNISPLLNSNLVPKSLYPYSLNIWLTGDFLKLFSIQNLEKRLSLSGNSTVSEFLKKKILVSITKTVDTCWV